MKILLIEDEKALARAVVRLLDQAGHQVEWRGDGLEGLDEAKRGDYDLLVLDVMLPGKNGWEILETLRKSRRNLPILMLTALEDTEDRVKGLDLGADDYLPKPFEGIELVARVNALLRRDKAFKGNIILVADLELDRKNQTVFRSGQEIHLTKREFQLLEALAVNQGKVLTREVIQNRIWGDEESYSNTVDVFIGTLRKKVDAPFGSKLIHTAVGFGYMLKAPEEDARQ